MNMIGLFLCKRGGGSKRPPPQPLELRNENGILFKAHIWKKFYIYNLNRMLERSEKNESLP